MDLVKVYARSGRRTDDRETPAVRPGGLPAAAATHGYDLGPARPTTPSTPADRARPPETGSAAATTRLFWSLSFAVTPATWDRVGGFCERFRATAPRTPISPCSARARPASTSPGSAAPRRTTSGTPPDPRRCPTWTTSSATADLRRALGLVADGGLVRPVRRPRTRPAGDDDEGWIRTTVRRWRSPRHDSGTRCIPATLGCEYRREDRPAGPSAITRSPSPTAGAWRRTPPWSPTSWCGAGTRSISSPRPAAGAGRGCAGSSDARFQLRVDARTRTVWTGRGGAGSGHRDRPSPSIGRAATTWC